MERDDNQIEQVSYASFQDLRQSPFSDDRRFIVAFVKLLIAMIAIPCVTGILYIFIALLSGRAAFGEGIVRRIMEN